MNLDRIRLALMCYIALTNIGVKGAEGSLRRQAKGLVLHDRLLNDEIEWAP